MIHIGFTGARRGQTPRQRDAFTAYARSVESCPVYFHHGDCVGWDDQAHRIVQMFGWRIIIHPPSRETDRAWAMGAHIVHPAQDYRVRNRCIVDDSALMLACPGGIDEVLRSGTWSTIRYTRSVGKPLVLFLPDGDVIMERTANR